VSKGDKKSVIIIKKIKKGHGGHHGGAWKVAYADFVTAMMAFFMVMWILGMDQNLRNSVEGYFSNPVGFKKGYTAGKSPLSSGNSPGQVQQTPLRLISRKIEEQAFGATSGRIKSRLKESGLGSIADNIEIIQTQSGLRIELSEDKGRQFFSMASAQMTETMTKTLQIVGHELAPLRNPVIIEGHTDASQYAGLYSNWELSADRANAARRVMEEAGLTPSRVVEVRGMADRQLRFRDNPLDPRNRRITIFLPFESEPTDTVAAPVAGTPGV
jgi:chemotaxis protein MotB